MSVPNHDCIDEIELSMIARDLVSYACPTAESRLRDYFYLGVKYGYCKAKGIDYEKIGKV